MNKIQFISIYIYFIKFSYIHLKSILCISIPNASIQNMTSFRFFMRACFISWFMRLAVADWSLRNSNFVNFETWFTRLTIWSFVSQVNGRETSLSLVRDRAKTSRSTEDRLTLERSCLLYTSPSPRDRQKSRMPSSA